MSTRKSNSITIRPAIIMVREDMFHLLVGYLENYMKWTGDKVFVSAITELLDSIPFNFNKLVGFDANAFSLEQLAEFALIVTDQTPFSLFQSMIEDETLCVSSVNKGARHRAAITWVDTHVVPVITPLVLAYHATQKKEKAVITARKQDEAIKLLKEHGYSVVPPTKL